MRIMAETDEKTLESLAQRFVQNLMEGKEKETFQEFEMSEGIRSWIQAGMHKSVHKDIQRQFGGVGELQKSEIVRPDPQNRSVDLFYSGKTYSFKTRVSFQENQIIGVFQLDGGTPVQLKSPTGTIHGTLLEPGRKNEPVPVVLFLAGSGPTDRNGNQIPASHTDSYRLLAEALLTEGIASVRFDKRGIGASADAGLGESKLRFEHYVDDAVLWIELLSQKGEYSKIIVMGHSEGSLIGMLACLQSGGKADGFISLCGAGRPVDELLREQLKNQPRLFKDTFFPMLDQWKQGKTVEKVPPELLSLARPSVQPYMISWVKYDPQAEIKKLTIPTLIVQGTTDIQISLTDAENLSRANPKAKKIITKEMNHHLKAGATTINDPQSPIHAELVPAITQWITEK